MRALVYTSLFPNSVQPLHGNFVLERLRHLLPLVDMTVVAPVPYFPRVNVNQRWFNFAEVPHTECFAGFEVDHPRYFVIPKIGMTTHAFSMFAGSLRQVRKRLRDADFDLIDAHYLYPDGLAAIMLGALLNKPVVVSARGSDANLFPQLRAIRPMVQYVLRQANAVIAVSQALKSVLVELGCPAEKITVIGNAIDPEKFSAYPKLAARQKLGIPDNRSVVLTVGHLQEVKGFDILIEAVHQLRARRPDVMLVIVGEGPGRKSLERQISALGAGASVKLVGSRPHDQLAMWYSAADVFGLASSREGWPNVVSEAIACGVPVVATQVGGIREIVTSAALGTLVERTPAAFATAIDQALDHDWDRPAIAAYGRSRGWDKVAASVFDVYSKVIAECQ